MNFRELIRVIIHRLQTVLRLIIGMNRLVTAGLHCVSALFILKFYYPYASDQQRNRVSQRWARTLLGRLGIQVIVKGHVVDTALSNTLLVANHISWLDIFALSSQTPSRFVAKKEIRHWPLIGGLIHTAGTLFIDRSNRRDIQRINTMLATALATGQCMTIFPEATTTAGSTVLPFKASLFESAILAESCVLPITIRYLDANYTSTIAPAYIEETTLWQSICRILTLRTLYVELNFGYPLQAGLPPYTTRFALSSAAYQQIEKMLNVLPDRPDTVTTMSGDPLNEAPSDCPPTNNLYQ